MTGVQTCALPIWYERNGCAQIQNRERLLKGEQERIKQLKKVNEFREEERKLRQERDLEISKGFVNNRNSEKKEQGLKEKDEEEQRLKEEEQRLKI